MNWRDLIETTPGIRSGQPRLIGTRITVQDVLEYLAGGDSIAELLKAFPELSEDQIKACVSFAAEQERMRSETD